MPDVRHSHHLADKHNGSGDCQAPIAKSRRSRAKPMPPLAGMPSAGGGEDLPSVGLVVSMPPKAVINEEVVDMHCQYPAPTVRGHWPWIPPPPAESGHPETGAEFAACVKNKFIL